MKLLFTLIGLVMILEGMPYVAFPEHMRKWLKQLSEMRPSALRGIGLAAMALGLLICYITQGSGLF